MFDFVLVLIDVRSDLEFSQGHIPGARSVPIHQLSGVLAELDLDPLYHVERNPLPWLDEMLNAVEHANFFENRATEYSKAATQGSWEEAFE